MISKYDFMEIGVHLHSHPDQAVEKVLARMMQVADASTLRSGD